MHIEFPYSQGEPIHHLYFGTISGFWTCKQYLPYSLYEANLSEKLYQAKQNLKRNTMFKLRAISKQA